MISGMKGAGVKDLTQFLMEQACIILLLLSISYLQIIVLVTLRKQQYSFPCVAKLSHLVVQDLKIYEIVFFLPCIVHMHLFFFYNYTFFVSFVLIYWSLDTPRLNTGFNCFLCNRQ
jgi:hypothetical protein